MTEAGRSWCLLRQSCARASLRILTLDMRYTVGFPDWFWDLPMTEPISPAGDKLARSDKLEGRWIKSGWKSLSGLHTIQSKALIERFPSISSWASNCLICDRWSRLESSWTCVTYKRKSLIDCSTDASSMGTEIPQAVTGDSWRSWIDWSLPLPLSRKGQLIICLRIVRSSSRWSFNWVALGRQYLQVSSQAKSRKWHPSAPDPTICQPCYYSSDPKVS